MTDARTPLPAVGPDADMVPPAHAVGLWEWFRVVRRVRAIKGTDRTRLAHIAMAWADTTSGANIFPSNALIADELDMSDRTVKRLMGTAREFGVMRRVRLHNGLIGKADSYQLSLPFDLGPLLLAPESGSVVTGGGDDQGTPVTPGHSDQGTPTSPALPHQGTPATPGQQDQGTPVTDQVTSGVGPGDTHGLPTAHDLPRELPTAPAGIPDLLGSAGVPADQQPTFLSWLPTARKITKSVPGYVKAAANAGWLAELVDEWRSTLTVKDEGSQGADCSEHDFVARIQGGWCTGCTSDHRAGEHKARARNATCRHCHAAHQDWKKHNQFAAEGVGVRPTGAAFRRTPNGVTLEQFA